MVSYRKFRRRVTLLVVGVLAWNAIGLNVSALAANSSPQAVEAISHSDSHTIADHQHTDEYRLSAEHNQHDASAMHSTAMHSKPAMDHHSMGHTSTDSLYSHACQSFHESCPDCSDMVSCVASCTSLFLSPEPFGVLTTTTVSATCSYDSMLNGWTTTVEIRPPR